jgi:ubiquinone/menaquinone biosynthesis C-methylase UbiE
MDHEGLKEQAKFVWSLGDYRKVAEVFLPAARRVVAAGGIQPGAHVADVGAGTGNLAILAAEAGAKVVASDLTPAMVEIGRARSAEEGHDIEWLEADAEDLPFEDHRFDVVMSMFAAMFAPRPDIVSRELFRVAKPGGKVVMANWAEDGASAELLKMLAKFMPPPPPDLEPTSLWGNEDAVRRRFGPYASDIEIRREAVRWDFPSMDEAESFFENNVGPAAAAKMMLDEESYAEMQQISRDFHARISDTPGRISYDSEFLLIVATKGAGS